MPSVVDKFRELSDRLRRREQPLPFPDTLSVESSYACNLKCFMCPRHFDESLQGMFEYEMWKTHVVPVLARFKYVHLTGWGEPLMNKSLPQMLTDSKEAGCWTCFTSNGLLLKDPLSRRILESGVDMINISCDASEPETYEIVRGKGTFDVLQKRMRHMIDLRAEMGSACRLEWAFVMMKNNIEELPGAVRLAVEYGFERFYAKHMETAINREDLANALWNTGMTPPLEPEWAEKRDAALEEARHIVAGTNTELVIHPLQFVRDNTQCVIRPANQIFIDYKGYVSACCYHNKLDVQPYKLPHEKQDDDGVMGQLGPGVTLVDLIDSPRFEQYRREWFSGTVPKACHGCVNLNRMEPAAREPRVGDEVLADSV